MSGSEQQEQQIEQPQTPRVGEQLKAARIAQNRELAEIAATLCLDSTTLDALESDNEKQLPEPIFVQGYIQNYARLLGLDPQPLLALYKAQAPEVPELKVGGGPKVKAKSARVSETMRFSQRRRHFPFIPLLLVAGLLVGVWLLWGLFISPKGTESVGEIPQNILLQPSEHAVEELPLQMMEAVKEESSMETIEEPTISESVEEAAVPQTGIEDEAEEPPVDVDVDHLRITTEQDSWVEIQDAQGKRVVYDLLRGGSSREVSGEAPFKVLLGYAHGIELSINGESFDVNPYIRKNSARFSVKRP